METDVIWEWVQKFLQPSAALIAAVLLALTASKLKARRRTVSIILWVLAGIIFVWSLLFFAWLIYALIINLRG